MYQLLIVEDEWIIREGLRQNFDWNAIGFEVVADACDGELALKQYHQLNSIDVILTDIRMPMMDGIEMTRKLREAGSSVIVVFLSGYSDFSYAQQGIKLDVFDYILKPTKDSEIRAIFGRVRRYLDSLTNEKSKQPTDVLPVKSKAWYAHYDEGPATDEGETGLVHHDAIQRAKEIIEKKISDHLTLEDLAAEVFLCPTYFSYLFKHCTGMTFISYLTARRMEKARCLLTEGRYKVFEISQRVGYDDYRHFSKVFKKHFGHTPTEHMKK